MSFKLTLRDKNVNIFQNLPRDDFKVVRQSMIDMVLATDMTKHFDHLNKFVSSINSISAESSGNAKKLERYKTPENKVVIKRLLIKCSDVANPLRKIEMSVEWAKRISEEYFSQTDEEKKRGYPVVMAIFDRDTCNMPKTQVGFIDFFINNLFKAWDSFSPISEPLTHLARNYDYWQTRMTHESDEPSDAAFSSPPSGTRSANSNSSKASWKSKLTNKLGMS